MDASKALVKLIRQKQEGTPGLNHEEAYHLVSSENHEAVDDFLRELGLQVPEPNSTIKNKTKKS